MRIFSTIAGRFGSLLLLFASPTHLSAQDTGEIPSESDVPIAILVDLSSGQILHARNEGRRFMPASITKVMTAYVAFELLESGELRAGQRLRFSRTAFEEWGGRGSTMFLNANERPTVSQLLLGITTVSANDASAVLAEGAAGSIGKWLELMNASARSLKMKDSHFGTPNGWPDEGRTFTTARDLALLGQAMVQEYPGFYRQYFGKRELTYRGITQPNHEPFTGRLNGGDGIKTGFTNEAGYGVLGSAERNGRRLILVVAGTRSGSVRARAARSYMEWGFSNFESKKLFEPGEVIGTARIQGGNTRHVSLVNPRLVAVAFPKGADAQIKLSIRYDGPIRAPVAQGQEIAELEIAVEGMATSRIPLYASEDVGKAGPLARIINGIIGWFS